MELLVAELLTNAVKESRALEGVPPVRFWLLSDKTQVVIMVWDASARPPVRSPAGIEDEDGRGLLIVETLSTQWNWYTVAGQDGKVIWAAVESE